ncbi:MAG: hypothetical protein AAF211_03070 [Myxococcota bacterium]
MIGAWLTGLALGQSIEPGDLAVGDIDVQTFRPSLDLATFATVDVAAHAAGGRLSTELVLGYHRDLLTYTLGDRRRRVVGDVGQANLLASWARGPLRIGAGAPVVLLVEGAAPSERIGLGDVSLDGRVTLTRAESLVDVAVQGSVSLPTSTLGDGLRWSGFTGSAALVASRQVGRLLGAINLGWRGLPRRTLANTELDDVLEWRGAVGYATPERTLAASIEASGRIDARAPFDNRANHPVELTAAVRTRFADGAFLRVGAARGITVGIGSPTVRAWAGLAYSPEPKVRAERPIPDWVRPPEPAPTDGPR